jgi:uncharacterized protein (UPF0210 family)
MPNAVLPLIRSITTFVTLDDQLTDAPLRAAGEFSLAARTAFNAQGLTVQTTRLATQPLAQIFRALPASGSLADFARALEAKIRAQDIQYAALGLVRADDPPELAATIPAALAATENIFASIEIADHARGLDFRAINSAAQVMRTLADLLPDGFGNFRFAALANGSPHVPFFPVAYHEAGKPAFALAMQAANLAVDAFTGARSLDDARDYLIRAIEANARVLVTTAEALAQRWGFEFAGLDFSLAPFPAQEHSLGHALEQLTGARFGERGTLFAAAFATDCLRRAEYPRVGLSGLFFPVLEDSTLAARSFDHLYSLDSLLLYSAVCGTGLDTIPLPGDTTADALAAILLDLATLAVRLNKPLTARLIPLAGLKAGDSTRFNFEYFANARVLETGAGDSRLKVLDSWRLEIRDWRLEF